MATVPPPPPAPKFLREVLELEQLDTNLFRSRTNQINVNRSLFGGQILGQGLKAATETVATDRVCHSLHGYFLLAGASDIPVIYDVELTRDGGSFSTRRVVARQRSRPIFHMELSFHRHEQGLEHTVAPHGDVPDPDELLDVRALVQKYGERLPKGATALASQQAIIELKPVNPELFMLRKQPLSRAQYWIRSASPLPDDPLTHLAGLAYLSDYFLVSTAMMNHAAELRQDVMLASLDHAMWFHSPPRADEWILVEAVSPFAGGARGLTRAEMFSRDRKLVASVAQEGLMRLLEKKS
ncbi:MAG: acyl-CoA thioesterase II [Steroidobacter sp.]